MLSFPQAGFDGGSSLLTNSFAARFHESFEQRIADAEASFLRQLREHRFEVLHGQDEIDIEIGTKFRVVVDPFGCGRNGDEVRKFAEIVQETARSFGLSIKGCVSFVTGGVYLGRMAFRDLMLEAA